MKRVVLLVCPIISFALILSADIFDDFRVDNIDTRKWMVHLATRAKYAQAIVKDGKLLIYGNGRWSFVESKKRWQVPIGKDGKITFTFCISSWRKFGEENICDSGIWLIDASNPKKRFGFGIFWKKEGKYSVLAGKGHEIKVNQKVTASIENSNYLRITLSREKGRGFCKFEFSEDGRRWKVLYQKSAILPKLVKLQFAACWGKLAVDFVQIDSTFPIAESFTESDNTRKSKAETKYQSLVEFPIVYIPKLADSVSIKLDGRLTEELWSKASKVLLTNAPQGRPSPPTQKTYTYIFYDNDNLYIAYECFEDSMNEILASQRTGGSVWNDDCVELFIQPDIENQPEYIFHLIINPKNAKTDELGLYTSWSSATRRYKNKWTVEIILPFSTLGFIPEKGTSWKINFNREERPHSEYQSWAPVRNSFHDTERFGFAVFNQPDQATIKSISLAKEIPTDKNGILIKTNMQNISKLSQSKITVRWNSNPETKSFKVSSEDPNIFVPFSSLPTGKHLLKVLAYEGNEIISSLSTRLQVISDSPIASTFWPTEDYDNILYLTDCGMTFVFWLVNDTRGGNEGFTAILECPYWLEVSRPESEGEPYYRRYYSPKIVNCRSEIIYRSNGLPDKRRITITTSTRPCGATSIAELHEWQAPFEIWFRPVLPKGIKPPYETTIKFYVKRKGLTEPVHIMKTVILPKINGRQPKRFPIFAWTNGPTYPRRLWADQLEYFSRIGLTGLQGCPINPEFEKLASRYGITIIDSLWGWYHLPDYIKEHPDTAAVDFEGKPSNRMVCPEVFLDDTSGAFKLTFRRRTQNLTYCPPEGFDWDLEGPNVWRYCFCKRCLNAFKKYANLPDDMKLTPKKIKSDKLLSKKWIDFVLEQNKKLIIKWDKAISKFRPGARLHINGGAATNPHLIYERMDWKRYIPYIGSAQMFRYCNSPQASATSFYRQSLDSLKILESANRQAGSNTPIMAVLTTGYMRVSERLVFRYPQLTALQMLEMAGLGYKGIYYWHWYTNDGRFDSYISKGCSTIAEFEDYIIDGKRFTIPKEAFIVRTKYLLPLARELNKNILVILLNFNPRKSAKVKINPQKLSPSANKMRVYPYEKVSIPIPVEITIAPLDFAIVELKR